MIGIGADVFKVVVLAAGANALLAVGSADVLGRAMTQEDILELVHARVGEQQRLVADRQHRRTGHKPVILVLKKVNKRFPSFV